jgi:hypothetical protein
MNITTWWKQRQLTKERKQLIDRYTTTVKCCESTPGDPDIPVAISQLAIMGCTEALPLFIKELTCKVYKHQSIAAFALAQIHHPQTYQLLVDELAKPMATPDYHEDKCCVESKRGFVVRALGRIGDTRAIQPLSSFLMSCQDKPFLFEDYESRTMCSIRRETTAAIDALSKGTALPDVRSLVPDLVVFARQQAATMGDDPDLQLQIFEYQNIFAAMAQLKTVAPTELPAKANNTESQPATDKVASISFYLAQEKHHGARLTVELLEGGLLRIKAGDMDYRVARTGPNMFRVWVEV